MAELRKFDSINILKCIAILMVLTVHQGQMFKHCSLYEFSKIGQLGCQCFFVISGFTLCYSWDNRKASKRDFFMRRFKAIAPGYYFDIVLFTLLSIVIQALTLPHYWSQNFDDGGISHIANILFLHSLFPNSYNAVVPGGWYIGTIILMYLSFPMMKKMLELVHSRNKYAVLLLPWAFTLLAVAFWYLLIQFGNGKYIGNNTFGYFHILTQYPCFIIGGAIYTYTSTHGYLKSLRSVVRCLTLTIISFTITIILFYSENEFIFCLVPLTAASFFGCLLVLMVKFVDLGNVKIPTSLQKLCAKISGVSYEMYLLHTLFAYFIVFYIRKLLKMVGGTHLFDYSITFILFTIALTVFSYYAGKGLQTFLKKIINLRFNSHNVKIESK